MGRYIRRDQLSRVLGSGRPGLVRCGPERLRGRLEAGLAKALDRGSWANTYAASNADEYWAVAVQAWFDVGGSLNGVDTRPATCRCTYPETSQGGSRRYSGIPRCGGSSCHIDAYERDPDQAARDHGKGARSGLVCHWRESASGRGRAPAGSRSLGRTRTVSCVLRASDGTFNIQVLVLSDIRPGAGRFAGGTPLRTVFTEHRW